MSAEETARAYISAQAAGDWSEFCALMTKNSQESIQEQLVQRDGEKASSCTDTLEGAKATSQEALKKIAALITVSRVEEDGDKAVLVAKTPDGEKELGMVREDGNWRVALVP